MTSIQTYIDQLRNWAARPGLKDWQDNVLFYTVLILICALGVLILGLALGLAGWALGFVLDRWIWFWGIGTAVAALALWWGYIRS